MTVMIIVIMIVMIVIINNSSNNDFDLFSLICYFKKICVIEFFF
jgi:hypothetical protein